MAARAPGPHRQRAARGFTLIELLVALFICTIVFAMGYGALNQAISHREHVEQQAQRLLDVQQAMRTLEQDFALMQPRPVRDIVGGGYLAPLVFNANALTASSSGGTQSDGSAKGAPVYATTLQNSLVNFTRGGWANPAGVPRSELQRVGYVLRDHKLVRQYLPVLDADSTTLLQEVTLLDDVESLKFRFMDGGLAWYETWPTPITARGPAAGLLRLRPVAIEVTLRLKDYGTLKRIIEVAG
jgi:general secretion pathway protein J